MCPFYKTEFSILYNLLLRGGHFGTHNLGEFSELRKTFDFFFDGDAASVFLLIVVGENKVFFWWGLFEFSSCLIFFAEHGGEGFNAS